MLTWPEAEVYCRDVEEGHLTSVRDLQENNRIEKILRRLRYYFGFSKVWIGASDLYHVGRFEWTDESPFRFERWIKGEPSGQGRGKKEDCAVMTADPHWGHWKDEHCLHHLPFMCRKDGQWKVFHSCKILENKQQYRKVIPSSVQSKGSHSRISSRDNLCNIINRTEESTAQYLSFE